MKSTFFFSIVVGLGLAFFLKFLYYNPAIPSHLQGHVVKQVPDLITEDERLQLVEYIKNIATFPTAVVDTTFYKTLREHVGEGVPYSGEGKCPHQFLVPNSDRTMCVLPGRIDVGRHFMMFGGAEGMKEKAEVSISRLLSFMHYAFNHSEFPLMEKLFSSDYFVNSAKEVCPPEKQHLDPFQVNFILQIPSQSVALHVDGVYFWGADRFLFPQWLLAVMKFSGLFEKEFIDQIQVVAYLHAWDDPARKGEFVHYNNKDGKPTHISPTPRFGSVVDGSKVIHAATIYRGKEGSSTPILEKEKPNVLRYLGDENWEVFDGEKGVANYTTDDLRISLVFRARCFADEGEVERFQELREKRLGLSLEKVFNILKKDMREKRKISFSDDISAFDFSLLLMDTYVHYPRPQVLFPYNYCVISKVVPALAPLVNLFC